MRRAGPPHPLASSAHGRGAPRQRARRLPHAGGRLLL